MMIQLNDDDLAILRLRHEEANTEANQGRKVDVGSVVEAARQRGMDDARIKRSLENLTYVNFIRPAQIGKLAGPGLTSLAGFHFYGVHFLDGYENTVLEIAEQIKKNNRGTLEVSRAINKPLWLVGRVMDVMREQGTVRLVSGTGLRGVQAVTPLFRQIYGE